MFPNPAIKAYKAVAEPTLGTPVHRDTDQILADNHRDMRTQAKHPSTLRKRYDHSAIDDHQRLPLSQLTEYLLTADSLKASGASQAHRAALECLSRTVTSAYEKSPCFRRLFNQAWVARLHDPQARSCLAIGNGEPHSEVPALSLPDVLKRGPKPKYETAAGPSSLSDKRAVLNSTVKVLTQLPDTEPGHPRGPNTEYVNIILIGNENTRQRSNFKPYAFRTASNETQRACRCGFESGDAAAWTQQWCPWPRRCNEEKRQGPP